jgi:hypothetical protein
MAQAVLVAAVAAGPAAAADDKPEFRLGQGWTMLGAQTTGDGANVIAIDAGFPTIAVTYLHGVTSIEDVGVRIAFNYAYEGLVTAIVPGLRGEAVARLRLLDTGRINLGVKGGVGLFAYFTSAYTLPGITIPLGLVLGIPVGSAIAISTGIDVPLFITFGPTGGLTAPVLFDAGLEYWLNKGWEASLHARMGPAFNVTGPFLPVGTAQIAFEIGLGMAFKL